ncbi:hypothetical protein NG799_27775 [Laspinema sp. D1]|uniref:Uncharacterized protein n=1 Tax=Laspinema palackyanum D2a TaxID=2953684 RepID=A0ABT2MZD1_9CYAN|nr:hypothetical protein [Laspinema sp. D2a]
MTFNPELSPIALRTQARQYQQSETIAKPPTEQEIHQKFIRLPQSEQTRINSLPPSMRLTALRQLGTTQTTQTTQATPNPQDDISDVPPAKIAEAEAFFRSLPDSEQILLGALTPAKRLCRIWELKDRQERQAQAVFKRK